MTITPFLESLRSLITFDDELHSFRRSAWERFEEIGLPLSKDEAFQYINLRELLNRPYQRASLESVNQKLIEKAVEPYQGEPYIVLYNGHFTPRHSNFEGLSDRIIIKPLTEAFYSYGVFLKNLFQKWIQNEKNPFVLLSIALHTQGLFIYVPSGHIEPLPIRIIEINDANKEDIAAPLVVTSCGKNSQLNFITLSEGKTLTKQVSFSSFFFNLEERAQLCHTHLVHSQNKIRLESVRSHLKKEAHFKSSSFVCGVPKSRLDYEILLLDKRAQAEVCSLAALREKEQTHMHILIEHKAEECLSRQLVKTLLDDQSIASFEGKILVDSIAQQTNAYQLNQTCLLSDEASSYSKPNLEIFADDVKASHGSTTGQIDKDQLFYLRSRGLEEKLAKKLLLKAFCKEAIDEISHSAMKEKILKNLSNYFEHS